MNTFYNKYNIDNVERNKYQNPLGRFCLRIKK